MQKLIEEMLNQCTDYHATGYKLFLPSKLSEQITAAIKDKFVDRERGSMTREELIEELDSFDLVEDVADFILQLLSEQRNEIAKKINSYLKGSMYEAVLKKNYKEMMKYIRELEEK